jgi:hypothetical protein
MRNGIPDQALLNAFGVKWGVEFLGPPVKTTEQPTGRREGRQGMTGGS